jgi:hypothetical protein
MGYFSKFGVNARRNMLEDGGAPIKTGTVWRWNLREINEVDKVNEYQSANVNLSVRAMKLIGRVKEHLLSTVRALTVPLVNKLSRAEG